MQIKGTIRKDGKFWVVSCPTLQADTQGLSRKEALEMAEDWVRGMIDDPDFDVIATMAGDREFVFTFSNPQPILGLIMQRTRAASGLTLEEVGLMIGKGGKGVKSAVRIYETGKHDPGFKKAQELVHAMGYELRIELVKRA